MRSWTCAVLGATPLLLVSVVTGAVPTLSDLSQLPVADRLSPPAVATIQAYVEDCLRRLRTAENFTEIEKARTALVNGFRVHSSPHYQMEYASAVSAGTPPFLSGSSNTLADVKQVNLAMAVAEMPQVTILPALEALAEKGNAAARYHAAKGLDASARAVLLQGGEHARRFLALMERLGRKEKAGRVLSVLFAALVPPPEAGEDAARQLRGLLDRLWLARAADLHAGDVETIAAYQRSALIVCRAYGDAGALLAALGDAMEAASAALVAAAESKHPSLEPRGLLLKELEVRMRETAGADRSPVQEALGKSNLPEEARAAEARLQVNTYWKPLLEKRGVRLRFSAPPPATKTAPATGAGTAPAAG